MKITPGLVAVAVVCAAPFALAVREDLQRRSDEQDLAKLLDYEPARPEEPVPGDREGDDQAADEDVAPSKQPVVAADLDQLLGALPATTGPVLAGIELGAPSTTFLSEEARERIEAFKETRHLAVEFDYEFATVDGITLRALGSGNDLRDGVIARWGTPRRLGEDELAWLNPAGTRAVLHTMIDGIDVTFTQHMTVDALVAPREKDRLGVEPLPLVGARLLDVEERLGARLQESSYDDEWVWTAPGVGYGTGRTTVRILVDPDTTKVTEVLIDGATSEGEAIRAALVAKWGAPKLVPDEDDNDNLTWKRGGVTTSAYIDDDAFTIRRAR
jgi:hypothetical protein